MMLAFANVASSNALRVWRESLLPLLLATGLAVLLSGCENTDMQLATEAGADAIKAVTLSDQDVAELAGKSSALMDNEHAVAPAENHYAQRLR